jgi:hypothetical protein
MLSEVLLQKFRIHATCSTMLMFVDFSAVKTVDGEQRIPVHFCPFHPVL